MIICNSKIWIFVGTFKKFHNFHKVIQTWYTTSSRTNWSSAAVYNNLTAQPETHLRTCLTLVWVSSQVSHHLMVMRSGVALHPTQGWCHSCPPTQGWYQFYSLVGWGCGLWKHYPIFPPFTNFCQDQRSTRIACIARLHTNRYTTGPTCLEVKFTAINGKVTWKTKSYAFRSLMYYIP